MCYCIEQAILDITKELLQYKMQNLKLEYKYINYTSFARKKRSFVHVFQTN